jgi:hypothetical protein
MDKGVEDNDHRPLPLLAPDDKTSNNLLVSLLDKDLPMLVALHTMGHRTMPLEKAITKVDTVPMSMVATKFPPEFFHATEDQTVISGMGEDVSPAAMGDFNRKPPTVIPPVTRVPTRLGSFQALLDDTWPENITTNATLARLRAFVSEGARVADTALQDFDWMVQDFLLEREEQQEDLQNLYANRVDLRSIEGIVEDSMTSCLRQITSGVDAMLSTIAITSKASNKAFAIINEKFEESR